jgi:hypothetical protein
MILRSITNELHKQTYSHTHDAQVPFHYADLFTPPLKKHHAHLQQSCKCTHTHTHTHTHLKTLVFSTTKTIRYTCTCTYFSFEECKASGWWEFASKTLVVYPAKTLLCINITNNDNNFITLNNTILCSHSHLVHTPHQLDLMLTHVNKSHVAQKKTCIFFLSQY